MHVQIITADATKLAHMFQAGLETAHALFSDMSSALIISHVIRLMSARVEMLDAHRYALQQVLENTIAHAMLIILWARTASLVIQSIIARVSMVDVVKPANTLPLASTTALATRHIRYPGI